jgi:RecB family exonuclease
MSEKSSLEKIAETVPLNLSDEWLSYIQGWKDKNGEFNLPVPLLHPIYGVPVISHSQFFQWDRCQFAWQLSHLEGWKSTKKKRSLDIGTRVHKILQLTEDGGDENTRAEIVKGWMADPELTGDDLTNIAIVSWVTKRYLDLQDARDYGFTTLKFKGEPMIEFHFEVFVVSPNGVPFIIQGYIDKVYVDEMGRIWVRDYKTFSSKPITPVEAMMDPQLPLYAAGLIEAGLDIHGLEFECLNVYDYKDKAKVADEKLFVRERTSRTKQELLNILREVGYVVEDILGRKSDTLRKSLRRDCKMCDFNAPCLFELKGVHHNSIMDGDYVLKEAYR